jgi:hypothetical protein
MNLPDWNPGPGAIRKALKMIIDIADDEMIEEHKGFYKAAKSLVDIFESARLGDPHFEETSYDDVRILLASPSGRTRVSVINISGNELGLQRDFVAELLTLLYPVFTTEHPTEHPKPVNGLVVIDEAKQFVPSIEATPCKKIILRFATMIRKHRYGIVLASQQPKSIDTEAVNNCHTKLIGKQTSRASIVAGMEILQAAKNPRLSNLSNGQFYLMSPSVKAPREGPVRLSASWCLTDHSGGAPDSREILDYAIESARRLGRRTDS